jgi:putative flippase GtrA
VSRLFPRYILAFGIVGFGAYLVDVGIFNALRLGVFGSAGFFHEPLGAKIVSVTLSTLASWFGNRYFAFRERRRDNFVLELLEFSGIAAAGLGIGLGCLYLSHYVLGLTSLLADNISANIIGLVLATTFRFLMYRFWVYSPNRAGGEADRKRAEAERAADPMAGDGQRERPAS